ncbi:MAG TPA: peptidoglycan-binding protein [Candidatus Paceibacterota bacterium]
MTNNIKIGHKIAALAATVALVAGIALIPSQASAALYRQLQIGMSGSDVRELQTFLAADSSIYPEGLVTGYFGSLTKAAVARFQAKYGISAVGRVGPITLAAINSRMGGAVGADTAAPVIGPVYVNVSNSNATLSWNTSEGASAVVYYSQSPLALTEASALTGINISGATALANTSLSLTHGVTIPNLQRNTTYYYSVYVRDASGNVNITWPSTFRTN